MNKSLASKSAVIVGFAVVALLCSGALFGTKDKPTAELMSLAMVGASLSIDATSRPPDELSKIAIACASYHRKLHLRNCGAIANEVLSSIVIVGDGSVELEF